VKVPSFTPEKPAAAKSQPLPVPPPEPGPRRSEEKDYVPRYVALPRQWERGHGRRNLVGGVIVLVVAVLFLGWALYLAGPGALFTVAACVATATLLHVMARSRLFRQRNGAFVAWAGVCLLGVVLVILHHGWLYVTGGSHGRSADQEPATAAHAGETPLLRDAFPSTNDPVSGPVVRVLRDTKVSIDGKPYMAKQGELYPLVDVGVDAHGTSQVRFSVGMQDVLIPKAATEVVSSDSVPGLDPPADAGKTAASEAPTAPAREFEPPKGLPKEEQVLASQREAIRRYPELGRSGSLKNQAFVSAVKEQRHTGAVEFFDDPNWPLNLAEILAEKDGWRRADVAELPPAPRNIAPPEPVRRPPNQ
jgi:hypothetical protein